MSTNGTVVELAGESLFGIEVFSTLGPQDRRDLARLCQGRRYAAEQQIVSHKDQAKDVYFIVSGKVRVTIYSVAGKEITFRDQSAGEMFGELSAIDGEPRSAYVVAQQDSLVASMSAETFSEVLQRYPKVSEATLRRLAKLVRSLSARVFEFSALAVRNRIHAELLRLARDHMAKENEAAITPAPTHQEIANRVSTHREAVTRELNELTNVGLIRRQRGELIIYDVRQLQQMVEKVLGPQ